MTIRTAIIALSIAFTATPALAADEATAMVRIDDLNLTAPRDQQRLETRVNSAARSLCRASNRGVAEMARQSRCLTETMARAQVQVDRAVAQANDGVRLAELSVEAAS